MKLHFTEHAEQDLDIAVQWYERKSKGLGLRFWAKVSETCQRIQQNPSGYPVKYQNFRGTQVRKFPFTLFYTIQQNEIMVHSVFDNRQDPEKKP